MKNLQCVTSVKVEIKQMTLTQKKILAHLNRVETATKAELMEKFSPGYYCNEGKHFGEILTRMVKNGSVARVKQGVYAKVVKKIEEPTTNPNQLEIFN